MVGLMAAGVSVFEVGPQNKYGLKHEVWLKRLTDELLKWLHSDENGSDDTDRGCSSILGQTFPWMTRTAVTVDFPSL